MSRVKDVIENPYDTLARGEKVFWLTIGAVIGLFLGMGITVLSYSL